MLEEQSTLLRVTGSGLVHAKEVLTHSLTGPITAYAYVNFGSRPVCWQWNQRSCVGMFNGNSSVCVCVCRCKHERYWGSRVLTTDRWSCNACFAVSVTGYRLESPIALTPHLPLPATVIHLHFHSTTPLGFRRNNANSSQHRMDTHPQQHPNDISLFCD